VVVHANSVELRRGAEIAVATFGKADAGQLEITTSTLRLEGSDHPTQLAASAASLIGSRGGAGGGITVQADSVELSNGAGILAGTQGDGNAGTIAITAGSLALRNGGITTSAAAGGKGGGIQIDVGQLTLDGPFASITALTTGQNRQIPAGAGGVIDIKAGSLQLLNDSGISATTYGDGKGGDIHITADSLVLNTATFTPGSIPGITAASKPPFLGHSNGANGGDISIAAGSLTLSKGMLISASTSTPADGGSVHIQAGSLSLESESSIQSASLSSGRAGTITVDVTGQMVLSGQSAVSTSAPRSSGGNIEVRAGSDVRVLDSQITAQAGPGGGGNITVNSPSLVYLLHGAFNAQAVGDGGNLTVDPVFFILNQGALISKSSSANGGNITILSDFFLQSASIIDASAPFGLPGTIRVSAPQVDLSGSLIGLPSNLLGIDTQLRPDCGVRLNGNVSSFIVLGRGGLPLDPGGFVPSGSTPLLNEAR
jgi:large exoprotein involved in heme utilization and adhesion